MGSERNVRVSAVRVDDALDGMSVAGNRLNFIILDARRNNPFECRTRGRSRRLAPVCAASSTLIACATKPGAVAHDAATRVIEIENRSLLMLVRGR